MNEINHVMVRMREALHAMLHNPIRNYVVPGLTSWLVGGNGHGRVRVFKADRDTREWIVPHSHRFDFTCLVLSGHVTNILFDRSHVYGVGNNYCVGLLKPKGDGLGGYEFSPGTKAEPFTEKSCVYSAGDTYSMKAKEIHSIEFSRDSMVLFLEGPQVSDTSEVLEPYSNGQRIPTFGTEPWMFDRGDDFIKNA